MFLSGGDIREQIINGQLRIVPFDEEALRPGSIELRVGNEACNSDGTIVTLQFGDDIKVAQNSQILFVTLETISLPSNLMGFVFPRSAWSRVGLIHNTMTIEPGFSGKLALSVYTTSKTVTIYGGQKICNLFLAQLTSEPEHIFDNKYRSLIDELEKKEYEHVDVDKLDYLYRDATHLGEVQPDTAARIMQLLNEIEKNPDPNRRGVLLEDITELVFSDIPDVTLVARDARLRSEEIDFLLFNKNKDGFWGVLGQILVVECKCWRKKVPSERVKTLASNMEMMGPDAKVGILVTLEGITGDKFRDAVALIRDYRLKGKYIIVLDKEDLKEIANGCPVTRKLEKRYTDVFVI